MPRLRASELRSRFRRPASERGFTLIELLVVIIILGILAAVVVFAVNGVGDKGKSNAITIDERTLRTAEEAYCAKFGEYADGATLVAEGFLSDQPEYHQVFARPNAGGSCNGWRYSVLRTAEAGAYPPGQWAATNPPPNNMYPVFAVRMADGRVLVGGSNADFDNSAAAIWDPVTALWTTVDPLPEDFPGRIAASAMLLSDDPSTPANECASGTVDNCSKVLFREKFLFDPQAPSGSQWETLSFDESNCYICGQGGFVFAYEPRNMVQIKGLPSVCGTLCGRILMTGGAGGGGTRNALLYNPSDNTYVDLPFGGVDRLERHMHLTQLPDGRIFLCCGGLEGPGPAVPRSDFFDPLTLTFSPGPAPPRVYDRGTPHGFGFDAGANPEPTPVLPNGDLFFGREADVGQSVPPPNQRTAGIYTPQAGGPGVWSPTVLPCSTTDSCNVLGSLPDGRVLAKDGSTSVTYAFNPATKGWEPAGELTNPSFDVFATSGDAVFLDSAEGPCGPNCGKLFYPGWMGAELFNP